MENFLEKLSAERCADLEVRNTLDVASIFKWDDEINVRNLYVTRFGRIPNQIKLREIDCQKAGEWILQTYRDRISDCFYVKCHDNRSGMYYSEVCYFLFDDLLVYLREKDSEVRFFYRKTDSALVNTVVDEITLFKKERTQSRIKLLVFRSNEITTKTMEIFTPCFSIEDNYNDSFLPVHQTILERLAKEKDKGLVLLHGKPGTGKTSYIRYLITKSEKPVIFLPPGMASTITDPNLMNVLIDNPNSVFVIEDAENIIIDRNRNGSSSVSALLNLADGLLSDCLNIQIVCSFNTDLSRVDSALTRKGRLIAKYEFAELSVPKAQALSNKLGFSSVIDSPMTLASVYNQNEMGFAATTMRKTMGFKVAVR